jgi:RNA polymerase sigma-70 factor (ECF subfamily)
MTLETRAQSGCVEAFEALCARHRTRIWRIVCSVARGAEAEDLHQETLLRAYRALSSYRGQAPFEAWLARIAVNVAHDFHRSAWRRRVTLFDLLPTSPIERVETIETAAERRELQRRVRQAVAVLPESQRVPIWLHYFEGFSLVEIARLERVPEGTLRSRLRAGLRRLGQSLEDLLPELEMEPQGGRSANESPTLRVASGECGA